METAAYSNPLLLHVIRFSKLMSRTSLHARKIPMCHQVSFGDFALLMLLERTSAETGVAQLRMSDISEHLGISKPAATQLVAKMMRHGMLTRVRCTDDKRSVLVRMTPQATFALHAFLDHLNSLFADVAKDMGESDAKEFDRLLSVFYESLMNKIQKEDT